MNIYSLWKQPWFRVIVTFVFILTLILILYQVGKYKGKQEEKLRRDVMIVEQNKEIQSLQNLAAKHRAESDVFKKEADDLKIIIEQDKKNAAARAKEIEQQNFEKKEQIQLQYEKNKKSIDNMSDCDRCVDICNRANALADTYGGFFEEYRCDAKSNCSEICNTY